MTGFARVRRPLEQSELMVSVKSVNHRALDLVIQSSAAIDPFEAMIRAMVKAQVVRGHVEVRVSLPKSSGGVSALTLNREFFEEYLRIFRQEAENHDLDSKPDLNAALRIAGMLDEVESAGPPEGTETALQEALARALDELNVFRSREGSELAAEVRAHNTRLGEAAEQMEQLRDSAREYFHKRLSDRLRDVAAGIQIDPQRLAQEAALLADRSDIGEELARLKIHSGQLAALMEAGGEVGKKLDFLLQEMNRETNTILSKTSGSGEPAMKITDLALGAKAAIEKIREQSLNLE
ncbi:MAG: YicC family protein [Bryobacterales bacterium]|nr:YicC family protein [Bryobacterales bacterium]